MCSRSTLSGVSALDYIVIVLAVYRIRFRKVVLVGFSEGTTLGC